MAIQASSSRNAAQGGGAPSVRSRTRAAAQAPQTPVQPGATDDWMKAGAAAIQASEEHKAHVAQRREERAAEADTPYRFWLAPGEEADVVILDADFGPAVREWNLTRDDRFKKVINGKTIDQYVLSPIEWEVDPLVNIVGKEPYHAVYLTIKDLRSFEKADGSIRSNMYRLMPLQGDALDMMVAIRAQQMAQGHTTNPLRGVQLLMKRSSNQQSLRTGLPMFVARHSEQDIMETFGHEEVRSEKDPTKVLKPANAECFPVDYRRVFPKPSADEIRRRFNLAPNAGAAAGSRADTNSFWNDGGQGGDSGQGGASTEGFSQGQTSFQADLDDEIPFASCAMSDEVMGVMVRNRKRH